MAYLKEAKRNEVRTNRNHIINLAQIVRVEVHAGGLDANGIDVHINGAATLKLYLAEAVALVEALGAEERPGPGTKAFEHSVIASRDRI